MLVKFIAFTQRRRLKALKGLFQMSRNKSWPATWVWNAPSPAWALFLLGQRYSEHLGPVSLFPACLSFCKSLSASPKSEILCFCVPLQRARLRKQFPAGFWPKCHLNVYPSQSHPGGCVRQFAGPCLHSFWLMRPGWSPSDIHFFLFLSHLHFYFSVSFSFL